ncbi:hypothetical protein BGZ94_007920 [Podila epigama]|nr:hypothetical protein BGZ94_007920 [Podila epigama]
MKGLDETRAAINRRFNYDFMQLHASTNTFSKIEPAPRMAKGNAYTKFTKAIQKLNKKVKSLQRLVGYQQSLKHAVDLVCKRDHADLSPLRFISVDIESYEQDHSLILEIGWSTWDTALNKFADRHFAVHNYKHLANGRYVADRRDRFLFGDTVWANLSDCIAAFQEDLNTAAKENDEGSVVLIAHDMSSDETYLRRMGVEFPQGMIKFDTVELNSARINDSNTKTGLGKLLDEVGIENYSLHNAGESFYI